MNNKMIIITFELIWGGNKKVDLFGKRKVKFQKKLSQFSIWNVIIIKNVQFIGKFSVPLLDFIRPF